MLTGPVRHPDPYHSCYVLAGLSLAQHRSRFERSAEAGQSPVDSAFRWRHVERTTRGRDAKVPQMFEEDDMVQPVHPIFVVPFDVVERTRAWFDGNSVEERA